MADNPKRIVETCVQCDLFFKETLSRAMSNQHISTSEEVAFYLLQILVMGMKADPHTENQAIAKKYLEALAANRVDMLRVVGDRSLIIAGIWWQSLWRKLVDVDYYIKIGADSYQRVSESGPDNLIEIFEELSENFERLVNILAEATRCVSEANMNNRDILRMYEVWLRTHNDFIAEKLRSLGINPVNIKTTKQ